MAREIKVNIVGDSSSLEKALGKAGKSSQSNFSKISKAARVAGLAIAGGLAVVAKVGFDELADSQKVIAQTGAVLKSTGGVAKVTARDVDELATSLSRMSGVDDELIGASENLLLTFTNVRNEVGKGNKIFDQATAAILDMSVATGTDLQSATLQVGKALQDPVKGLTALRRVGVAFSKSQENLIKKLVATGDIMGAQKVILAELNKEFAGSAKAAGNTLPGQLAKARNAFDEVAGTLVESLLPAVTGILKHLTTFTKWAQDNPEHMRKIVIGLGALAVALVAASVAQTALNLAVLANPYVAAAVAIVALAAAMVVLYKKFAFVRRHWQLLLLGFGLAPVVVATVVKAIIRHWDSIKPVLQSVGRVAAAVFNSIRAVAVPVFNTIRASVTASITAARVAFQTLKPVAVATFNAIRAAVSAVVGPIVAFVSWVRAAIGAVQSLANAIRSLPSPSLGDVGNAILPGNPFDSGATGGHITTSGLLNVHRGEDLVPARITRNVGTGTGNGSSGGRMQLALVAVGPDLLRELRELERRSRLGGSLG